MDFLALPRRDLQALCKRNDIRANMTSAAMADALRALPKVEGIEEYVKVLQPVAVPQTAVKSVDEEQKQERPLPRGRRASAKSSESIEPEEDKEKLEEHAQAPGVGRRGASRRARPGPPVPLPPGKAVAEEEGQEDNLKREAKRDNAPAPAPVVARRGASRRARPSPAVAAPAADSEVAGAEEEQIEEVVEDLKREATMDDAPALGVGRRGASRRTRAAPSVAELAGKLVAEEQRAPIPRAPRVMAKGTSTEPIRLDDSDDEEKEDAKPEEQEDAQILGVGRRGGASRRAQAAPAVAAPEAEEEQRAPVPRGRRVKANSTELLRMDDSKEEKKEDTKAEEEKGDAPGIAVGRRGASRRAPAPSEAPATRRSAAASKAEAGDVAVEDAPIRATGQRKPTMKAAAAAAAAAEEKAPRRATRRGAVTSTLLQQQEVQEEAQDSVGAPVVAVEAVRIRETRHRKPTMKAAAAVAKAPPRATRRGTVMRTVLQPEVQEEPQGVFSDAEAMGAQVSYQRCDALEVFEEVYYPQKQELSKDEDEDVVIIEDEKLNEKTPAEEPSVTDHECTDKSEIQEQQVDHEKCHSPLATQEDSPIHGVVSMATEQASEDDGSANFQDCGGSSSGVLDKGVCEETYDAGEEIELVPGVPVLQDPFTAKESDASHESEIGSVREEISEVDTIDDEVCKEKGHVDIAELQADIVDEAAFLDCSGNISLVTGEETNEDVNTEDGLSCQEEGDVVVDKVLHESVDDTILSDCSSDISLVELEKAGNITSEMPENQAALDEDGDKPNGVAIGDNMSEATVTDKVVQEEKGVLITNEVLQGTAGMHGMEDDQFETVFVQADQVLTADMAVNTEDGLSYQEEGDVVADKVLHDSVDNTILLDCSSDISWVEVEKAGNITSEMPENQAALDEDGDEPNGVVIGDSMFQATVTDEVVQEEKGVLITDEIRQGTAGMHDMEDDHFETVFVQADNLPEQVTDCEITVEVNSSLTVDERQQSTDTVDENVVEDRSETDGVHSNEQIEVVTTDKVPELNLIEDVLVQADQVVTDDNLPEQVTDCEITVEENTSVIVDEKQQSTVTMDEDSDQQMEVEVPELIGTNVEVIEKTPLGVDEKQKCTVPMDTDVVDDQFKADVVHADEQMEVALTETDDEVVEEMKTPLVVDEKQQSTVTDNGDIVDDHFKTTGAHADEQNEVVATEVPEVTGTDSEIEVKTPLIVDVKKQSTITMDGDVVFDHLKTDTAHADEQKEVIGVVTEVPDEVTGTDGEVIEEKAVVITEDMPNQETVPNITHTMDECLKENNFGTDFGHGNEQKKAITAEIEPEVSRAQDGGAQKETQLVDDVTESLSKRIISMEPSVCKNSSEKNPAEPMVVLDEKGVKVASESEDLTKLSLGQLRAKLKERLNAKKNKEAKKRVALARVDENVCQSHAKGQQQNLNLQQH